MAQQNFRTDLSVATLYLFGFCRIKSPTGYAVIRRFCAIDPQLSPRGKQRRLDIISGGVAEQLRKTSFNLRLLRRSALRAAQSRLELGDSLCQLFVFFACLQGHGLHRFELFALG